MVSMPPIRSWYRAGRHWCAGRWRAFLTVLAVLPAVLVALSILLLAVLTTGPDYSSGLWYRGEAARCMSAGDFATARLCYAGLVQKSPDNPGYKYGLATSLSKLGEHTAAAMLMRQLAPEDAAGYPPAQLEVANKLLNDPSPKPEALRSAEALLQQVLKVQPKNPDAHSMLAVLYSKSDKWDMVKQHMAFGGAAVDELALPAALAFAKRGDRDESEVWARRAAAYYAPRVKADPKNDDQRLKYAQAYLLLRDFTKTLEILDAGWQQNKEPRLRSAVAQVTALWLRESPTMEIPRRLALLENALTWDPQNAALLEIVLDPDTAAAAGSVNSTTAPVGGAAIRALVQAVADCRENHPDKVKTELELALSLGGRPMASITAYVCGVWADSKSPDASSALTLSTILLQIRPKEPVAQWAQGKVLAQQGKWTQAVGYLEAALTALPEDRSIHGSLATAYEKLGQPARAAKHRRLAQPATVPTTAPATVPKTGSPATT